MSNVLNDPTLQLAALINESQRELKDRLAQLILATKSWNDMNEKERALSVEYLVRQSESEGDLSRRLDEAGCSMHAIQWMDVDPSNQTSLKAQMLVKALGGSVGKNGALVNVATCDDIY